MLPSAVKAIPHRIRRTRGGIELPRTDGRTLAARRFRALCEAFAAELGGAGDLSEVDQNLIRQAANLVLTAEKFQADVVNGAAVDLDALVRVSSEARRILGMLRAKADKNKPDGAADLQAFLAARAAQPADDADATDEVAETS